ncbi:MAG: taurine catabolism dioxygenase TauD [Flavobacteriales bacterium]|nr:taurine catabolism dioxygenase TauD [Flavobacteriales bacterium]
MPNTLYTVSPNGDDSKETLVSRIASEKNSLKQELLKNGAIMFRGYNIRTPEDFEAVALALEPGLQNNYAGTSPRNSRTKFVHSASELPGHYPIMQHCEMSFLPTAPRYLFFFCYVEPKDGGETPICDFRKVYEQMDPKIRRDFEEKGVRLIRNYTGPNSKSRNDVYQLKKWDELFKTTDHEKVEEECKKNDLHPTWLPDDRLRLVNDRPSVQKHPETGEMVWFNHLQVFHREAAAIEYEHIYKRRGDFFSLRYLVALKTITFFKRIFKKTEDEAMHMVFADGSEIPRSYVEHVEKLIWDNLVATPWKLGDVLMIDNFSTSHGRLPYKGPRDILVAWSA